MNAALANTTFDKVRDLQDKLYQAAKRSPTRRFHALYDKVHRPDFLWRAWVEVAKNGGAPGVDGVSIAQIEEGGVEGVRAFLDDLASELKDGTYRPLPVRRVTIEKSGGGERHLGVPAVRDRVVQAAAKLLLEPIYEADFLEYPPLAFDRGARRTKRSRSSARRSTGSVLQARLAGGRTRKAKEKVEAEIAAILAPRWVSRVMTWSLTGKDPAELRLSFDTDTKARAALEEELFGKRIPFSDKTPEQASTRTIVSEYRSQECVEGDFRQMKDPKVVAFSPMFHFTESKIRVHVLYCVLALMTAGLMVREADHAGMHVSVRELLSSLAGIEETLLLYQGERGRPRVWRMLTDMDPTQRRLYDLFAFGSYAPTR